MEMKLMERPTPLPSIAVMDRQKAKAYREVAAAVGVVNPNIVIDDLKDFLSTHDLPVFSLAAVSAFMDDLTARDNPSKLGWEWRPVREADRIDYQFGRPATEDRNAEQREAIAAWMARERRARRGGFFVADAKAAVPRIELRRTAVITPASDYYAGADAKVYDRTIPLHALTKIGLIEKEFSGRVAFMITDYVTLPHVIIEPDPFLMAVIPNKGLAKGVGRFVIDVWDEPGFGIAQMLK